MVKKSDAALIIGVGLSGPTASLATALSTHTPVWAPVIAAGAGLISVYRQLAQDRGAELLEFLLKHQDEFAPQIVESAEFKTAFLNVWEMHIRENSENKRKRLQHFLLNFGAGEVIPNDTHTKIYSIIEQMTDTEAIIFGRLIKNANQPQFRKLHINSTSVPTLHNDFTESELKDSWHSLHSYRLINITDATIGSVMVLEQITPFGELFYNYVIKDVA